MINKLTKYVKKTTKKAQGLAFSSPGHYASGVSTFIDKVVHGRNDFFHQ